MRETSGADTGPATRSVPGSGEREVERLRDAERDARHQVEILKRCSHRLAAATSPRELAETIMLELKALGIELAELSSPAESGLAVLASVGLSEAAVARIESSTLSGEWPSAVTMRTDAQVSIRPAAAKQAYPAAAMEAGAIPLAQILAWPLHDASGSVLGALSIGLEEPLPPSAPVMQILVALVEQAGLALGRALETERRREVERELTERHRMVTELTALVPGLLYIFDLPRQRTVFVNDQAMQILGYGAGAAPELSADDALRLLHPDDTAAMRQHLNELANLADGETRQVQYRLRHHDGTWRWFQGRDSVLRRDASRRVVEVIGVATDVTEEKRAQSALLEAADQDRFRAHLADALREAETPQEAQRVAARLLGEHLGATRVHYGTVTADGAYGIVEEGYDDAVLDLAGRFHFDDYGQAVMGQFRAGSMVCIDDVARDARLTEVEREATLALGLGSYVMAPLMRMGRPIAVLVVHQSEARSWTPSQLALIEETAERTQATVERALAVAALEEREVRYRSLFSSIDEGYCLCEIVTDAAGRPIDYRFLEVNPRFEEVTGLTAPVDRRAREMVPDLEDHWVQTMGRVALEGETVRYENRAEGLNRWFDVYAAPVEPIGGGQFVVVVNDATERHQADEMLRHRAESARRARARSDLVASVMAELEAIDRLAPLAERLVQTLVPRLADYAALEVPGREEPVLAIAHRDPSKLSVLRLLRDDQRERVGPNSVTRAAAGEPRLIETITPDILDELSSDPTVRASLDELAPRSHIAVPIDFSGEAGALLLGLSDPQRPPYSMEELALAEEIARRVSVFFAHARVREDEHAIGVRLQQALLPAALLSDPAIQVAARYQTASDLLYVGGDWYDTVGLPDGRIVLAVGDVVGHGLDAAAAMSRLRIALAALAPGAGTPGELLAALSEFSAGANGVEFATTTCAFLDSATGELSYASAGHPPPLVVTPDGAVHWLDGGRSTPIGAVSLPCDRPDARHRLGSGDVLILYSDGLVERRREPISTGLGRLESAARSLRELPIDALGERLMKELTQPSASDDDAVILCLRFSPVTAESFQRRIPAHPGELARTRQAVRSWLRRRRDAASLTQRLLLAVGEALTNAIEHAYRDRGPGVIDLSIQDAGDDSLHVTVHDDGRWREASDQTGRGRGFGIIRRLTLGLERESDATGTTLRFRLPLADGSQR
jgi:PAS domain S-box-containing protein